MDAKPTESVDVYCPICLKYGRHKLLFQKQPTAKGIIHIKCRGCKETIKIDLDESH